MTRVRGLRSGREERALLRETRKYREKISKTTDKIVRKPIEPSTESNYADMMREWSEFIETYDRNHDPQDVKTAKDFVLFFCSGRTGYIDDEGLPTKTYVHTSWKNFMAAWGRANNVVFPKPYQDTISNFIDGGEGDDGPRLSDQARVTRNFTNPDHRLCSFQLWANDWHDFVHERYRIALHDLALQHCTTSARKDEYEKRQRYGMLTVSQVWSDDKTQPQIMVDFKRTAAKGLKHYQKQQPEHMLYELVNQPFYLNRVLFFMAGALADGVFRDFSSWEEICNMPKPRNSSHVVLVVKPSHCDRPVYPRSSRNGVLSHDQSSTSLADHAMGQLGHRVGFRDRVTLHAPRREVLLRVDNYGYSCNERMQFAGHLNPTTYRRSYQTSLSTVDGQAAFFGFEPGLAQLHELRRSFTWHRNPNLWPNLREKARQGLEALLDDVDDAASSTMDRKQGRQKRYDKHRRRVRERLGTQRKESDFLDYQQHLVYESDFQQSRKLMPERDRLAEMLFEVGSLRDRKGRQVMADLISLCRTNPKPTHCFGLNPSADTCGSCTKHRDQVHGQTWWFHLYHCRRAAASRHGGFAEFCCLCFVWYETADAWCEHAKHHVCSSPPKLPLSCNLATFRGNVIRPALCPVCLADPGLPPVKRFRQYLNPTVWRCHVKKCLVNAYSTLPLQPASRLCHPRCPPGTVFHNARQLLEYLANAHEVRFDGDDRAYLLENLLQPSRATKDAPTLTFLTVTSDDVAGLHVGQNLSTSTAGQLFSYVTPDQPIEPRETDATQCSSGPQSVAVDEQSVSHFVQGAAVAGINQEQQSQDTIEGTEPGTCMIMTNQEERRADKDTQGPSRHDLLADDSGMPGLETYCSDDHSSQHAEDHSPPTPMSVDSEPPVVVGLMSHGYAKPETSITSVRKCIGGSTSETPSAERQALKRSRGRPKGSKNKSRLARSHTNSANHSHREVTINEYETRLDRSHGQGVEKSDIVRRVEYFEMEQQSISRQGKRRRGRPPGSTNKSRHVKSQHSKNAALSIQRQHNLTINVPELPPGWQLN